VKDEALHRQEVVELTSFVQRDPAWADLRAAMSARASASTTCSWPASTKTKSATSNGGLVTTAGEMFEFQRSSERGSQGFVSWERVANIDTFTESFPAAALR
jgi:hypothetical protein